MWGAWFALQESRVVGPMRTSTGLNQPAHHCASRSVQGFWAKESRRDMSQYDFAVSSAESQERQRKHFTLAARQSGPSPCRKRVWRKCDIQAIQAQRLKIHAELSAAASRECRPPGRSRSRKILSAPPIGSGKLIDELHMIGVELEATPPALSSISPQCTRAAKSCSAGRPTRKPSPIGTKRRPDSPDASPSPCCTNRDRVRTEKSAVGSFFRLRTSFFRLLHFCRYAFSSDSCSGITNTVIGCAGRAGAMTIPHRWPLCTGSVS